ncbi:hypothetical protein ACJX0J_035228, partial [Zea mays]
MICAITGFAWKSWNLPYYSSWMKCNLFFRIVSIIDCAKNFLPLLKREEYIKCYFNQSILSNPISELNDRMIEEKHFNLL